MTRFDLRSVCKQIGLAGGSYAEILFIPTPWAGLLLGVLALVSPAVGLAGALALTCSAVVTKTALRTWPLPLGNAPVLNGALTGMGVGYFFGLSPASLMVVVVGSIMAVAITAVVGHLLYTYTRLPVLSVPFVIVTTALYFASLHYAPVQLPEVPMIFSITPWIDGYFSSLGTLFFLPSVGVGICISLLLLSRSPLLFCLSLLGFYGGVLFRGVLLGDMVASLNSYANFNYMLVAMGLGGIFLLYSRGSVIIALAGVAACAILIDCLEVFGTYTGVPLFTNPFNITLLVGLYVVGVARPQLLNLAVGGTTAEERIERALIDRKHFGGGSPSSTPLAHLPFKGTWTVWQTPNGPWTHQGPWAQAWDFYRTDDEGKSHRGEGNQPSDYYAFGAEVGSPVMGKVVRVINSLPDNPIGTTDHHQRWGNAVVIRTTEGYHFAVAHLMHQSVTVAEGQEVATGQTIGRCGNSGYSPQPHIHLHAQVGPDLGAATRPLRFAPHFCGEASSLLITDIPKAGDCLTPTVVDRSLRQSLGFAINQELHITLSSRLGAADNFSSIQSVPVKVGMNAEGCFFFETEKGKLYFGSDESTFYCYRSEGSDEVLDIISAVLPQVPLVSQAQSWKVAGLRSGGSILQRWLGCWAMIFNPTRAVCEHAISRINHTTFEIATGSLVRRIHFEPACHLHLIEDELRGVG